MAQIVASMKQNFFTVSVHEVILHQSLFPVLLLSSIYSSQREYLFIVFYNDTHSFIFYFYKALII